jgi:hypothetical protein
VHDARRHRADRGKAIVVVKRLVVISRFGDLFDQAEKPLRPAARVGQRDDAFANMTNVAVGSDDPISLDEIVLVATARPTPVGTTAVLRVYGPEPSRRIRRQHRRGHAPKLFVSSIDEQHAPTFGIVDTNANGQVIDQRTKKRIGIFVVSYYRPAAVDYAK